ncbi:MAG: hypothetical protein CL681_24550, partial [Blastopirellula sp.]|nr:hypothetical protein [Blastopirellula sp.]
MKCPKCEAEVVSDALFCQHCGASLQPDKAATPAEKLKGAAPTPHDQDYDPEEELWQGGYSAKAMYGIWLAAGLASFGLLAAAIFLALTGAGMPLALGAGGAVLLLWIAIFACALALYNAVHTAHARRTLVAASWLLMPWLPISHLPLRLGTLVAERTLYLPSIGFILLVVNATRPIWQPRAIIIKTTTVGGRRLPPLRSRRLRTAL